MLRKRKNRRYNEETNDDDGERKFDIQEQIKSERFEQIRDKHLQELPGEAITLKLIQRNGFDKPILVVEPDGLDLRVPPRSFLVRDVRNSVGHQRIIDVMDVKTQKNIEMSMKDWCKYYESKNRDKLLNVISLEFSHTKLDELVDSPMIVKLLDWVDLVWPKFLKESQTEGTNSIDKMKYPKVQKYCLMSVKGSYTDFHIDFGGTSVWYHILRGKKIFWMVPPTELNLQTFEEWTLSGMQQDVFFGDTVEECFRVELKAGNTFFIPSGWIHAVYTLEDSLVFGGNFLHSFGIENQLKVSRIEDATKVPHKFRYPFYTEILWYVVQHYVYCLMEKDHLHRAEAMKRMSGSLNDSDQTIIDTGNTSIKSSTDNSKQQKKSGTENSINADESKATESEPKESAENNQKKRRKAAPSKSRKKSAATSKKSTKAAIPPKKSSKKASPPPATDDESTDIDGSTTEAGDDEETEEEEETPKKPPANTCRMTKNSLLRLQYEVFEDPNSTTSTPVNSKSSASQKSESTGKSSNKKIKVEPTVIEAERANNQKSTVSTSAPVKQDNLEEQKPPSDLSPTKTTMNLADMMLPQESKLNGWTSMPSGGKQTIWCNPSIELDEPKHVHLTRTELNGLKALVKHLSKLSGAKKNLPTLIRNSRALLDDCRKLIAEHENDDPELAITGKPITRELLKTKRSNMNELIGQFFKTIEDTTGDGDVQANNNNSNTSINNNNIGNSFNNSYMKTKMEKARLGLSLDELASATQSKQNNSFQHGNGTQRLSSPSSTNSNRNKLPHKETKCLSPSKKTASTSSSAVVSSNAASSAASTTQNSSSSAQSSPSVRPKSPPTRPLSNKQYTSKTKNDNNLLLPGSFASLIAATSSEKKVFDVSPTDVTALFGAPQRDSLSSKSKNRPSTSSAKSSHSKSSGPSLIDSITGLDASSSPSGTTSKQNDTSGSSQARPGSPEPPKAPLMQKRYINPAFKPQSKEKLIFASAPYSSSADTNEQSRASSHAFQPWQTPSMTLQHGAQLSAQTAPRPPMPPPSSASSSHVSAQTNYTPSPMSSQSQVNNHQSNADQTNPSVHYDDKPRTTQTAEGDGAQVATGGANNQIFRQKSPDMITTSEIGSQIHRESKDLKPSIFHRTASPERIKLGPQQSTSKIVPNAKEGVGIGTDCDNDLKLKKPVKPRGPPKKSKEARQALDDLDHTADLHKPTPPIPIGAMAAANRQAKLNIDNQAPTPTSVNSIIPTTTAPLATVSSPATSSQLSSQVPSKSSSSSSSSRSSGSKKSKKHKPNPPVSVPTTLNTTTTPVPMINTTSAYATSPYLGQSVICGLVTQPNQATSQSSTSTVTAASAAGNAKYNPQSYLISRPLLFNPNPATFNPAQLHSLPRAGPIPLLTTAQIARPPLRLPAIHQPGARLVWTSPPASVNSSTSPGGVQLTTVPMTTGASTGSMIGGTSDKTRQPSAAHTGPVFAPPSGSPSGSSPATAHQQQKSQLHHNSPINNAALLSLATTALSTAPMPSSPALSHLSTRAANPQAIIVNSAAAHQFSHLPAAQPYLSPFIQRMPMTHLIARPGFGPPMLAGGAPPGSTIPGIPVSSATEGSVNNRPPGLSAPGQLIFARLPNPLNQGPQPSYLITQPGFMPGARLHAPTHLNPVAASQHGPMPFAFAAYKPPTDHMPHRPSQLPPQQPTGPPPAKAMKTKKVNSS